VSAIDPRALRRYYASFLAPGDRPRRILLTGHSHQAWPDVAREGLAEAFDDAAEAVDDKWARVFAVQDAVRAGIAARIGGAPADYALGASTHELVVRLLSALDWGARRHLVTTTREFHSLDRQLRRLAEAGVAITFVDAAPAATLAERLAAALRDDTAAVLASSVQFDTSTVVPGLGGLAAAAAARGVVCLIDAYHAYNVVPFAVDDYGPRAFVVAGGYKYAQWGEGACFLRVPPGTTLRPVYTGWFAGFAELAERRPDAPPGYAADGATRFAGATFDPASWYRARAVLGLFDELGLDVGRLRALSLRQTARLGEGLDRLGLERATPRDDAGRGGFVAVRVPDAAAWVAGLRDAGVHADARGDLLRLGPAPYVTDDELDAALAALAPLAARR
jgi:selenocysteine lyase/cysteine desulfurase